MGIIEEAIILLGISLDIFAVMECQGSLVAKIKRKQLLLSCAVLVIGQAAALGIGVFLSALLCRSLVGQREILLGRAVAAAIFICMGVRLLWKACRNERIAEHREEEFHVSEFIRLYAKISILTLLTGVALGFLKTRMIIILMLIIILTILVTVFGMYTGYRLGFEHKMKAYLTGGILLMAAGADVVVRYILNIR